MRKWTICVLVFLLMAGGTIGAVSGFPLSKNSFQPLVEGIILYTQKPYDIRG